MLRFFEKQISLLARDVDFTGKWRAGSIFLHMQEIAEEHVNELEIGFFELRKKQIAWVLTRMEVEMVSYPRIGETVTISTWPGETKHSIYPRYFEFKDKDGQLLGKAVSLWVLFSIEKRTMLSTKAAGIELIANTDHKPCMPLPPMPKIDMDQEPIVILKKPVYTDIDINRHVNNTKYIEWLCDIYPIEVHENKCLKHILINYGGEVQPQEELILELRECGNLFSLCDKQDHKSHFVIIGEWMNS